MFTTGIVSVTYRKLGIDEILELCVENGLTCIEIGSDVHAPKEDLTECARIGELARELGVKVISYGTYFRLGQYPDAREEFLAYIKAARLLGAGNLRLWAGVRNREDVTEEEYRELVKEAQLCAAIAAEEGMTVSFEFHGGTLTSSPASALAFIEAVAAPNATLYWQPNQSRGEDFNCEGLRSVLKHVSSIHTFAWDARSGTCIRYPLADHTEAWARYLDILAADGRDHALLLEFVKDDAPEQLASDARTVNEWARR